MTAERTLEVRVVDSVMLACHSLFACLDGTPESRCYFHKRFVSVTTTFYPDPSGDDLQETYKRRSVCRAANGIEFSAILESEPVIAVYNDELKNYFSGITISISLETPV